MTRSVQLLGAASLLAVAALGASPAFAAGTAAGTSITNTVTLNYQVGGVAQNQVSASDSFTVDRKVNLTVAEVGNLTTTATPGQLSAATAFDVTNTSNAPLDFALAVSQQDGGVATHGGTDNFDATNVRLFADDTVNGVIGSFDAEDDAITYLDQVAADTTRRVYVVVEIPVGRATNDVAEVRLTATAAEATTSGSLGATVTQTTVANGNTTLDTVFADTDANGNTARDGISFDEDDYTVSAPNLVLSKISTIISDPFNGTTNPKMIPEAIVEYCVRIDNSTGAQAATSVAIADSLATPSLDTTVTFLTAFGVVIVGDVTGAACQGTATGTGTWNSGTKQVAASIASIDPGKVAGVLFRVTVN